MLKIGITGGMGSGKSLICRIFQHLGVPVYYADTEARRLYDDDKELKSEMISIFGEDIFPDGHFSAEKMKEQLKDNPSLFDTLNQLVHPRVIEHSRKWTSQQKAPYILKEAALLLESGSWSDLDDLILVECPEPIRIQRVAARDGLSREEIQIRMNRQWSEEEKKAYCRYSIRNSGQELIIPQVLNLHQLLLERSQSAG
ncbi:MAG TPA: dephospho-CoA kinase [Chitinophagaceae bacterium]|nr:dephospho-CoA kinase [Chitinophagaceae bacterium]